MLTHHRKLVSLSWISTNLPIRSVLETVATIERKDSEKFSLLLTEPIPPQEQSPQVPIAKNPALLWIEISPYRIAITRQAVDKLNYRHLWEPGVYGVSRYWLNSNSSQNSEQLQLRNFTRRLTLAGHPLPQRLRVEYELWSKEQLGNYVLNLEIHF